MDWTSRDGLKKSVSLSGLSAPSFSPSLFFIVLPYKNMKQLNKNVVFNIIINVIAQQPIMRLSTIEWSRQLLNEDKAFAITLNQILYNKVIVIFKYYF